MICPICNKRKARRFCPAKSESICTVDCATEREVTIDCPSDCPHLVASRQYEGERRELDWSAIPFAKVKISPSVFRNHERLLEVIAYAVCGFAAEHRVLVDSDVIAALQTLAESYETLTKGIYYEKPLDDRLRHELYKRLKEAITAYKKEEAAQTGVTALQDETVRDALIFFTQVGAARANRRPKGRAYLDFLRREFKWQEKSPAAAAPLLITPY